jgi:hypothetical protein
MFTGLSTPILSTEPTGSRLVGFFLFIRVTLQHSTLSLTHSKKRPFGLVDISPCHKNKKHSNHQQWASIRYDNSDSRKSTDMHWLAFARPSYDRTLGK